MHGGEGIGRRELLRFYSKDEPIFRTAEGASTPNKRNRLAWGPRRCATALSNISTSFFQSFRRSLYRNGRSRYDRKPNGCPKQDAEAKAQQHPGI
jgi:hypothetical protein